MRTGVLVLSVVLVGLLAGSIARADPDALAAQEDAQIKLFAKVAPAVIFIGDDKSLGTGFFVTDTGLALTAAHVVEGDTTVTVVLYGGKRTRAKVIGAHADFDVALLQVAVDGPVEFLPLASTVDQRVGEWVGAVGHGLGGVWAFTVGMISNLYETKQGSKMVQTQIPLNPGNSGGPIFDRTGKVVAIVSRGATTGTALNLGVHVADAFTVFDQLLPACGCLAIDVPGSTPVFVDDALVGKGPRVLVTPRAGLHTVSTVTDGRQLEKSIHFPAERRVVLKKN
jgi:S1-C subfamily serine protease